MGKPTMLQLAKFMMFTALLMAPCLSHGGAQKPDSHPSHRRQPWAKTVIQGHERKTEMQFYYHDVVSGKNVTAVQVVAAPGTNPNQTMAGFGFITMFDDPLRLGPNPKSKLIGRAQGFYASDSREDMSMLMTLTCTFSHGIYNGSSVSIMARDAIQDAVREFPIVGGTGVFRMARGYAFAQTYKFDLNTMNAIVGYNVTILHY